ncbi:uncharacterized protein BDZ83DRAFT_63459 [Colletotrichum acutatum]|uniref:Secreted protein n=1 Tax=Glomerella acutata TaxID=27357 RepID=A0AAD8XDT3_GLOAC|nr:uncharacterized protein BDZ83DRAFT_63459 [Colletotrichum acutatum]KAK1714942.1 hypothetical protein BDZ83DRAFT_63459 [Colletotrichum acutatum]
MASPGPVFCGMCCAILCCNFSLACQNYLSTDSHKLTRKNRSPTTLTRHRMPPPHRLCIGSSANCETLDRTGRGSLSDRL